jgi:hypothetical protein
MRRPNCARRAGALAALSSTMFLGHVAAADVAPGVNVRTWAPSSDPGASLVLEPTATPGFLVPSAAVWGHYENDTVVLRAANGSVFARPVMHGVGLDVTASLGLGGRASMGLRAPTFLYDAGSTGLPASVLPNGQVPSSGFGDLALLGKATLVRNESGGFGLAALGETGFPTGAKTSFESDTGVVVTARVLADLSSRVASLQASAGYTVRTSHETWPVGGEVFGDQLPWALGVIARPGALRALEKLDPGKRQAWEFALHGSLPAGPIAPGDRGSAALSPVLLALSDRVGLGRFRDGFVLAGVDLGLDRAVGVPSVRVTIAAGWTFGGHDRDGDGIYDDVDQCPEIAEDFDGFEDADGCPEVDNDDDGIIDREDACPNFAGPPSSDPRKNGCPVP